MESMAQTRTELVARLRRIEGQVRGLQRMMAEGRPYEEVITQFMAARAALDKVGISLVADHINDCTRRQSSGTPCERELERALALFLRMDNRPVPEDPDEAVAHPEAPSRPVATPDASRA